MLQIVHALLASVLSGFNSGSFTKSALTKKLKNPIFPVT